MALNAGEIMVHLRADTSGLRQGLQTGTRDLSTFMGSASRVYGIVAALAGASGIGALVTSSIRLAASLEQSQLAFVTLLGSGEKAKAFLEDLLNFAKKTPFEFRGIQENARQLLAYGFRAEEVLPMLTAIGDATSAMGGGTFEIERVIRALGQMRGKGKVTTQEMNQLTEVLGSTWDLLARKLGVDIPKAMEMVEKGNVAALVGIEGVVQGLGTKYKGSMEAQSKTLVGLWSTTKDEVSMLLTELGQQFIDTFNIKAILQDLNTELGEKGLAGALDVAAGAFPNLTIAAGNLKGVLSPLADVILRLHQNLSVLGAAVAPFAVVFKPLVDLFQTLASMRDTMLAMGELALRLAILGGTPIDKIIKPTPPGALGSPILGPPIPPSMPPEPPAFNPALPLPDAGDISGPGTVFMPPVGTPGSPFLGPPLPENIFTLPPFEPTVPYELPQVRLPPALALPPMSDIYDPAPAAVTNPKGGIPMRAEAVDALKTWESAQKALDALGPALFWGGDGQTELTPFAQGGIVTGPTPALIGEAGPEAVVPLDRGIGNTINITVNGAGDPDAVAGAIVRRLKMKGILAV